jgi:hypothetical protein
MMKLSEAIRLGSMLVPQCFRTTFKRCLVIDNNQVRINITAACALGAAVLVVENNYSNVSWVTTSMRWPWIGKVMCRCPEISCTEDERNYPIPTDAMIAHLNDDHRWTRERIAEWVATIEPTEITRAQEQEKVHETV